MDLSSDERAGPWIKIEVENEDGIPRCIRVWGKCQCRKMGQGLTVAGGMCDRCWLKETAQDLLEEEDIDGIIADGERKRLWARYVDTSHDSWDGMIYDGYMQLSETGPNKES